MKKSNKKNINEDKPTTIEAKHAEMFVKGSFVILFVAILVAVYALINNNFQLGYIAISGGVGVHLLLKIAFSRYFKFSGQEWNIAISDIELKNIPERRNSLFSGSSYSSNYSKNHLRSENSIATRSTLIPSTNIVHNPALRKTILHR